MANINIANFQELFNQQVLKARQLRISNIAERKGKLKKLLSWIYDHRDDIIQALQQDLKKPQVEVDVRLF